MKAWSAALAAADLLLSPAFAQLPATNGQAFPRRFTPAWARLLNPPPVPVD